MWISFRRRSVCRCHTNIFSLLDCKLNFQFDRNGVFTWEIILPCTLINAFMNYYVCLGLPSSNDNNRKNRCAYMWKWWRGTHTWLNDMICIRKSMVNMRIANRRTEHTKRPRLTSNFFAPKIVSTGFSAAATFKVSFSQITNIISVLFSFVAFAFELNHVQMCFIKFLPKNEKGYYFIRKY